MRSLVVTAGLIYLSSAWAADPIDWRDTSPQLEDLATLERQQFVIRFDDGHGSTHTGMGFQTSGSRILTAAHVFPYGKPGDRVRIGTHNGLGNTLSWHDAKIAQLDPAGDVAVILPTDPLTTPSLVECPTAPVPGTPVMVYMPILTNEMVTGSATFPAIVTPLNTMPKVSAALDAKISAGNYPLSAQSGRQRLVAAGSGAPGVSGGAVWDVKRKCVAAIVSAAIDFDSLAERESTLAEAGNPPFSSFLIGAPIPPTGTTVP